MSIISLAPSRCASALVLVASLGAQPVPAFAALPDAVNAIRSHGCGGHPAGARPLQGARSLDEVARRIASGSDLRAALTASGYNAVQTASIHVTTSSGDAAAARLLEEHFCAQITDPGLREMGIARGAADIWIVLAMPLATPGPADASAVSQRVLELVNQARAQERLCGRKSFNATTSLKLSATLTNAALTHSLEMATHDYFEHRGFDGSTPASRVTQAGYAWQAVGENIAAGVATPEEVVQGWLQSPGHCENLMDPRFTDMGVAYVVDPRNSSAIVWTQVFAAARGESDLHTLHRAM